MKYFPLLFKNVFRKRTRTILTIISIVIPLILICLLDSFLEVLDRSDSAGSPGMFRLVTRHKVGLTNPIPSSHSVKVSQLGGVLAVTNFAWFGGTYIDDSAENLFPRFAVEPESFLEVFDDASIVQGSEEDWINDASGCIVGEDLMNRYGWRIGDKIVVVGNIYPVTLQLTIRGVYRAYNGPSEGLFFNRSYLEEALPSFQGRVGTIWTKAKDPDSATRLASEIDALFENSPYPTKTESEKAFQMGVVSMLGNVKLLITSMGVLILLVIILIAANTIAISARERIREIAVLRTMGFTRVMILSFIIGESLIMSLIGGIVGVIIFVTTFKPLRSFLATTSMGNFANALTFYPETILVGSTVSVIVGICSAIVPAIGSSRRPIREGLRSVG